MTQQERDAWAAAYRLYDEISPGLKDAAAAGDHQAAAKCFTAAIGKISGLYATLDQDARLILSGVYGTLEGVYKQAQIRAQAASREQT